MIKFNNVTFQYDKTLVLNDFSLEINPKDRICLFGDSGSGKTTILRLILEFFLLLQHGCFSLERIYRYF